MNVVMELLAMNRIGAWNAHALWDQAFLAMSAFGGLSSR
jgi:hypothetical protein